MEWIKIERDADGVASAKTINDIVKLHKDGIPIVLASKDVYGDEYDVISTIHDIFEWYGDIEHSSHYTHYLPLPKLIV